MGPGGTDRVVVAVVVWLSSCTRYGREVKREREGWWGVGMWWGGVFLEAARPPRRCET